MSHIDFERMVENTHTEKYIILDEYVNMETKLSIQHVKCGNIFPVTPKSFVGTKNKKPTNCPKCSHPSRRKTQSEMIEIFNNVKGYSLVSEYKNTHEKVNIEHLECGNIFSMRPNNFLVKGNRCPFCIRSIGEEKISEWLQSNNIKFVQQFKPGKILIGSNFISYDFKLEFNGYQILIEYDGRFHFEPFSNNLKHIEEFHKRVKIDQLKNKFAIDNDYVLIRIDYHNLNNTNLILDILFNDYLLSESTTQTIGVGNIDIEDFIINLQ